MSKITPGKAGDALTGAEREELERLRADKAKREDFARRSWDYYQASTCACIAAERYVHDCSKHGARGGSNEE